MAECIGDRIGKRVLFDAIPYVKEQRAARPQHATRFCESRGLVGKEHRAELTDDDIEACIVERQLQRVRLPPCHGASDGRRRGAIEHRLIQIGRDDIDMSGQCKRHRARDGAGARCRFQHARWSERRRARCKIFGVGRKEHRHEKPLVKLGNLTGELNVRARHSRIHAPSPIDYSREASSLFTLRCFIALAEMATFHPVAPLLQNATAHPGIK